MGLGMMVTAMQAVGLVRRHMVDMARDPALIGENFMPVSTTAGLTGLTATAATMGMPLMDSMAGMDVHAMIGAYDNPMGVGMHVLMYGLQAAMGAYSAYLVGKPRGEKL